MDMKYEIKVHDGPARLNKIIFKNKTLESPLLAFPTNIPPVIIIQHIPKGFIDGFAQRMNRDSYVNVKLAKNGDIIQNINGSTVTNRRKAFQILRKARSQSSISIQLLRDQQEKKLSFGIK